MQSRMADDRKPRPLIFVILDAPAEWLGVNLTDKAVLQALVGHLNHKRNGTEVWPSNERLASLTGGSHDTVSRAKTRLHEKGLIKIQRDRGKADLCTINTDMIRTLADPASQTIPDSEQAVDKSADHTQNAGGRNTDPTQIAGGTVRKLRGDPTQNAYRTSKRTTEVNHEDSSFGCSPISEMVGPPGQRELPVHAVVAGVAGKMSTTDPPSAKTEQPNVEKHIAPQRKIANSTKPP